MQRILVADVETTNFPPNADIVELSFIEIDEDLNILDELHARVKPSMPICPGASAAHGIVDADVQGCPTIHEVLSKFPEGHFQDVFLVAHNCQFDKQFLSRYWNIQGAFCTLVASRRVYPKSPNHKLQTLRYYLNLDEEIGKTVAHSAEGDTRVLLALLRRMLADTGRKLADFVDHIDRPARVEAMPFGKFMGTPLEQLKSGYREWLLALPDLDPSLRWSLENPKR